MKKDIHIPKVEDVGIAIVPEEDSWYVYLINLKDTALDGVLVVSKGYGTVEDREVKTSILRHLFEKVESNTYVKVELLEEKLHAISNEFWVSFWLGGTMYDRKYVFVTDSLSKDHFTKIPLVNKMGVLIK
jgi:hypothetical protein